MEQQSCRVPGPHFKAHAPGDSFSFLHPVSGKKYTLTVQELEQQTISEKRYGSDRWFYPTHFTAMSYTLSPEPDSVLRSVIALRGTSLWKLRHALTAMHQRHETILLVSALSAERTVQSQSCVETAQKKNFMQFVPLYTLSRWRVILNGVSYSTLKAPMKCH